MCSIAAIRIIVSVFTWFKAAFLLYTFAIGCYFASSNTLQQAFGVQFLSYGLSLIFISLLGMFLLYPFKFGVYRHNRFILAFCFIFEAIIFAEMINLGLTVKSYTYPEFSSSLQLDCSLNTPLIYTTEQCQEYFDADRTAGFRLVWAYYFSTKAQILNFQQLSILQGGYCCGFGPPLKCVANTENYPKNRLTTGVSSDLLAQRVTCSSYANFYPQEDNCATVIDYSTNPVTIGGCWYDLPVGYCLNNAPVSTSSGCSYYTEIYVVNLISTHASIFLGLSGFSLMFMLLGCCMWWKRKETDIFPDFVEKEATKFQKDYFQVKHDIEVRPSPDLLIEEGFLPPYEERDKNFGQIIAPPQTVKKKPVSAKYQPSTESKEEDQELGGEGKPLEIES